MQFVQPGDVELVPWFDLASFAWTASHRDAYDQPVRDPDIGRRQFVDGLVHLNLVGAPATPLSLGRGCEAHPLAQATFVERHLGRRWIEEWDARADPLQYSPGKRAAGAELDRAQDGERPGGGAVIVCVQ